MAATAKPVDRTGEKIVLLLLALVAIGIVLYFLGKGSAWVATVAAEYLGAFWDWLRGLWGQFL